MFFLAFSSYSQDCQAWFIAEQDSINFNKYYFFDLSEPQNQITNWQWDFGDGTFSSLQNPTHTYSSEDVFVVTLMISSDSCTSTFNEEIITGAQSYNCFVDFFFFEDSLNSNTIHFFGFYENDTIQTPEWIWDFGDGNFSNEQNPTHTFAQDSAYEVTLSINNGLCSTIQLVPTGTFFYQDECLSMFSFNQVDPSSLLFEFFDESWSVDSTYEVLWDFGDGTTSTDFFNTHIFPSEGEYIVTLFLNSDNCSSEYSRFVYAGENSWYPEECQAMFYFSQNDMDYLEFQFFDASFFSGNNNFWQWNFGDGNFSYEQNPIHVYDVEGEYLVELELFSDSCSSIFPMMISVSLDSVYDGDIEALFFPEFLDENTVLFHNISSGDITNWQWNFGDGTLSFDHDPIHDFDEVGIHEIALSVGNSTNSNTTTMFLSLNTQTLMYCTNSPGGNFLNIKQVATNKMQVYPNPVSNQLTIYNNETTIDRIEIYDFAGKQIISSQQSINKHTIDVSNYPAGIYLIKIYSEKYVQTATIIKN